MVRIATIEREDPADTGPAPVFNPSAQQTDAFRWVKLGRGHSFIEAVAGSGKTTTLVEMCRLMRGTVAFAAFNKKIADEIKRRTSTMSNVRPGTFHAFGFSALRQIMRQPRVEADLKAKQMLAAIDCPPHLRGAVLRLVSLAKQSVVGVAWEADNYAYWLDTIEYHEILNKIEDGWGDETKLAGQVIDLARAGVIWSQHGCGDLIDFDDMIWLPLLLDAPFFKNDWMLVDEAQDTNLARRMLAERMVKPDGRTVWVGDRNQSIYGFTGADSDAVDQIIEHFDCKSLPLTVTYRCSKAATQLAQKYVPHIEAHPNNLDGLVAATGRPVTEDGKLGVRYATPGSGDMKHRAFAPGDAVLCRLTKPLVTLCFDLLRAGVPAHVEGRDIGKQLDTLVGRWKVTKTEDLLTKLVEYQARETVKLRARDQEYAIEALNDRIDTVFILSDGCETVSEVQAKIANMFRDTEGQARATVTLSTIHKAKGREWDRVFILGWSAYMPSKWATQDWQKQQERNLAYVAVTRTKNELFLMPGLD